MKQISIKLFKFNGWYLSKIMDRYHKHEILIKSFLRNFLLFSFLYFKVNNKITFLPTLSNKYNKYLSILYVILIVFNDIRYQRCHGDGETLR